jgi:DNA-binding MarR family transcriptional regulator|tara:strand:+ start:3378 stop:3800 length:423 start_codon:yes stop_codon:yes gene_type:complete
MHYGELISSFLIDLQRLFRLNISIKDLTYSQTLAMISIPDDGIEMSELAWKLGLDNSTVTRLVIRLEKKNWVERKRSQRDQRAIEVFLTDKGALIQHDIEKEIDNIGEKIKSEVEKDQKESLLESLFSFQWILRKFFLKK